MGVWRMLYREARIILGFPPPPETPGQLAERICGEVKSELGGKKQQNGEDWILETNFQGRTTKLTFEAETGAVHIEIASTLETGPTFVLISGQSQREQDGERHAVASGLFVEGARSEIDLMQQLWKALSTGTRGNLTSLVNRVKGEFRYEDGLVRLTPEISSLSGPSAKYNVKSLLQSVLTLVGEVETAWSKL
jgi:hypothetical protein